MANETTNSGPSQESLLKFIEYTWKDIHFARTQNWTSITVVSAFHIGVFKIVEYSLDKGIFSIQIKISALLFAAIFALFGFLITRKHQTQLYKRLGWIYHAEKELRLDSIKEKKQDDKKKKSFVRGVGTLMGYFFLFLMLFDIICIFVVPISVAK